ncbi:dynein axonemal assembly factor 1 homolog [Ptychodera flava]|uniref:dynein axonemal assembly factor 1 homolog n=1 Tax=Ptychodera flava TaxID=63121 RepID=UPI00396AA5C8
MLHGLPVRVGVETRGTAAVQSWMPIKETTAVPPGMSGTIGTETERTTALHYGMSITETTVVPPEILDRVGTETEETKALKPGMSITETTAVHSRMSVTGTTAVPPGISGRVGIETEETTVLQPGMSTTGTAAMQTKMVVENDVVSCETTEVQPVPVSSEETENLEDCENGSVVGKDENERVERISLDLAGTSQSPGQNATGRQIKGSGNFMVHVGLNGDSYHQLCKTVEEGAEPGNVEEMIKSVNDSWKDCQAELDKNIDKVIANEASNQTVNIISKKNFGRVAAVSLKKDSLAISLYLPTLYNLYRVRHTCLSDSFPDSFEPHLITDKMREEAEKVGLKLKLKATYNQARFDELELFFINSKFSVSSDVPYMSSVTAGLDRTPDVSECFINSLRMF